MTHAARVTGPPEPAPTGAPSWRNLALPAVMITLSLLAVGLSTNTNGTPGALVTLALSLAAGLAVFCPRPGALLIAVLMALPLFDVSLAPGLAVLAGPVGVAVLAVQRRTMLSLLLGVWHIVALTLLSAWTQPELNLVQIAAQTLIWYLVIFTAYFLGLWIRRLHDRVSEEQTRRIVDLAEQRRALARELHDTAVRATTEVVMFAETAGHRPGIDPADAREFARISRTARLATDELRTLMESLRRKEQYSPTLDDLPVRVATWSDTLNAAKDRLEAAGFAVRLNEESEAPVPPHLLPTLTRSMAEITANIVRHGDRQAPVAMMSQEGTDMVDLLVINGSSTEDVHGLSGGSGLNGVRERLAAHGGTLEAHPDGSMFLTHLSIPLRKDIP